MTGKTAFGVDVALDGTEGDVEAIGRAWELTGRQAKTAGEGILRMRCSTHGRPVSTTASGEVAGTKLH